MKWNKINERKSNASEYEIETMVRILKDSDGRMVFAIGSKDSDDEDFTFGSSVDAYSKKDIELAKKEIMDIIGGFVDMYIDCGVSRLNNY